MAQADVDHGEMQRMVGLFQGQVTTMQENNQAVETLKNDVQMSFQSAASNHLAEAMESWKALSAKIANSMDNFQRNLDGMSRGYVGGDEQTTSQAQSVAGSIAGGIGG